MLIFVALEHRLFQAKIKFMTKLFVVGFPKAMSEIELDQLFTMHALVRKITIIRDAQTGESKGYAFVDMMDEPGAGRCIGALNGMTFGNRVMSVKFADQKPSMDQQNTNQINRPTKNHFSKNPGKPNGNVSFQKRPRRSQSD